MTSEQVAKIVNDLLNSYDNAEIDGDTFVEKCIDAFAGQGLLSLGE